MINVLIPMAGRGSRFSDAGYIKPKPFIDVNGKAMIVRVIENLKIKEANYILILRKEHLDKEIDTVNFLKNNFNVQFVIIDKITEGAASTALFAHKIINKSIPLLIANSDQIVDINIQDFIDEAYIKGLDGSILTFKSDNPKWSYAKINKNELVLEVKEKEVISEFATVGIYLFKTGKLFVDSALDMIINNDRVNNEFYVCPTYNYAIKNGSKIGIYNIQPEAMHGTGTPEDLVKYLERTKQ
jgi:dTDP-glucose pyrophosphorylase